MQNGELVYERGYGMADLDHGVPNTPGTVFHVASVSKQFTAAATLLLVDEGRLSLEDPADRYVPQLPRFGTPITIGQMILHTSGLRDQWELLQLSGWRYSLDLITDDDVMSVVARQRQLNFPPGSRFAYSNTGYTVLGQIVKRTSGRSLREFTTERIFGPLAMRDTWFRDDHAEIVPNVAHGYVRSGRGFRLSLTQFDTVGATGLLTTVRDLARWERNFRDGKIGGRRFMERMAEPGALMDGTRIDYAAGLVVGIHRGRRTVSHSGYDAGYRAHFLRFPDLDFAVSCLCNLADVSAIRLAEGIADIYLADRLDPEPPQPVPVDVPRASLAALVGTYLAPDGRDVRRVSLGAGGLGLGGLGSSGTTALVPLGDDRFATDGGSSVIEFLQHPRWLRIATARRETVTFAWVPAFSPAGAQLPVYVGTYDSAEIELPLRIAVRDGQLAVTSMKIVQPLPLMPLAKDTFGHEDLGIVRFRRGRDGSVSGLVLDSGGLRDFGFRKRR